MDGLSRIVGCGPMLALCGKHYSVQGRTLRHYAEIEAQILALRGNPFDLVREHIHLFDEGMLAAIFAEIKKGWCCATIGDCHEWAMTYSGTIFTTWQAIRNCGVTLDECEGILREHMQEKDVDEEISIIQSSIQRASGIDELGRLDLLSGFSEPSDVDTNWQVVVNDLVVEKGVDPDIVFNSTIEQLRIYGLSKKSLSRGGGVEDNNDMKLWMQNVKNERDRAVSNLISGKRWDD